MKYGVRSFTSAWPWVNKTRTNNQCSRDSDCTNTPTFSIFRWTGRAPFLYFTLALTEAQARTAQRFTSPAAHRARSSDRGNLTRQSQSAASLETQRDTE